MAGADRLYTPELLGMAVSLADFPAAPDLPHHGSARSRTCGSTVDIDLDIDAQGCVSTLGIRVRACAVGQAAGAIFARHAKGRRVADIEAAHTALGRWLALGGALPDWPGVDALVAARAFPARHGAIMLPWTAARDALSTVPSEG
jgi:NifU-like protein involved in Fe-S cluster formation